MSNNAHRAIIICGPTASGKTEFAHQIALKNHGEIVNADSMQLYKQLPIITASPAASLQKELPYHLYKSFTSSIAPASNNFIRRVLHVL